MIRSLIEHTFGMAGKQGASTDLSQLSASFKIDKGQAQPRPQPGRPAGQDDRVGTIDLGTSRSDFRVEPKLVMTTEGQAAPATRSGSAFRHDRRSMGRAAHLSGMQASWTSDAATPAQGDGQACSAPTGRLGGLGGLGGCDPRRTSQGAAGAQGSRQAGRSARRPARKTIGNLLQQGLRAAWVKAA